MYYTSAGPKYLTIKYSGLLKLGFEISVTNALWPSTFFHVHLPFGVSSCIALPADSIKTSMSLGLPFSKLENMYDKMAG
jgi:hypothetical protein